MSKVRTAVRRWLLLPLLVLVAWAAWAALTLPPPAMALRHTARGPGDPPVARGVYHVHSRASDGTGTIGEIAAAARRAGLQFVIATDHGRAFGRSAPPRYIDGVLCLDAVEISTNGGHYVALGMSPPPYPLGGDARDVAEDVARLGGFGIAAHPDSAKPALRWSAWDVPVGAIEWFNADSQWRDGARWELLPALFQYPWRPAESIAALFERPSELLRRWDELNLRRRVVGLAAADAHARMGLGGKTDPYDEWVYVKLPSYEAIFSALSLSVELPAALSGDAERDARAVIDAVSAGRVSAAFDSMAGPPSLSFTAESGGGTARQGASIALRGRVRLRALTNGPDTGWLVVIRNGQVVGRAEGASLEWDDTRPGVYRVEAHLPDAPGSPPLPWIVSNPIYVGMPRAADPAGALPPPVARLVWPAGSWRIEKDATSAGRADTSVERGAIRHTLRYELGPQSRSPFVAMASRDVGAMHDATRLGFRAAADRPMRLSVQVRLVDGAAERRWQRSVYLSPEPRDVTILIDDMRAAGTGAREPFPPSRIHSLLFVVDTVNARPGDRGVAWVEGLRTER